MTVAVPGSGPVSHITPEALVDRADVELVVNLTPIAAHFEATSAALAAEEAGLLREAAVEAS